MKHEVAPAAPIRPPCPVCGAAADYEYSGRDLMYDLHLRYDYFACPACASAFQHPMPDMETIATFYPDDYMVFDEEKRTRDIGPLRLALLRRLRGYDHLSAALPYRLLAALLAPFQQPTTTPALSLIHISYPLCARNSPWSPR